MAELEGTKNCTVEDGDYLVVRAGADDVRFSRRHRSVVASSSSDVSPQSASTSVTRRRRCLGGSNLIYPYGRLDEEIPLSLTGPKLDGAPPERDPVVADFRTADVSAVAPNGWSKVEANAEAPVPTDELAQLEEEGRAPLVVVVVDCPATNFRMSVTLSIRAPVDGQGCWDSIEIGWPGPFLCALSSPHSWTENAPGDRGVRELDSSCRSTGNPDHRGAPTRALDQLRRSDIIPDGSRTTPSSPICPRTPLSSTSTRLSTDSPSFF